MTQDPDDTNPDDQPEGGPSDRSPGGARKLDEDAAWRAIVENYGDRANLSTVEPGEPTRLVEPFDGAQAPPVETTPVEPVEATSVETPRGQDSLDTEATWNDEGHFVPPEPPPLPPLEPRRKLAWIGLFGSPLLMLTAIVFGWSYPGWIMGALVIGFVGGFGYLVATMPRNRPEDWTGDDGAVV